MKNMLKEVKNQIFELSREIISLDKNKEETIYINLNNMNDYLENTDVQICLKEENIFVHDTNINEYPMDIQDLIMTCILDILE